MEILGEKPERLHTSYHRIGASGKMESQSKTFDAELGNSDEELSGGFHTYGVQWKHDMIVWYLDGQKVWWVEEEEVSDQLMYVIVNLAVGGNFNTQTVSPVVLSTKMLVDYVLLYQERPSLNYYNS